MFEGSWKMRSNIMDSGSWSGIILFLSKWFIQEDPCTHGRTAVCFQFELQGEGDMYKAFYLGWILLRLIQVREWVINTNTPQQGDMQTWKVCSHNISGHGREFLHKQKWVGHGVGGSDLTTTCVMLLVILPMSSSRSRSPGAFRTALYWARGCWFPAVL